MLYADGMPLDDPTLSPINASMAGLTPVHLNVAPGIYSSPMSVDYATRCTNADVTATYIEQSGGRHTYSQRIHTGEAQWTIALRSHVIGVSY